MGCCVKRQKSQKSSTSVLFHKTIFAEVVCIPESIYISSSIVAHRQEVDCEDVGFSVHTLHIQACSHRHTPNTRQCYDHITSVTFKQNKNANNTNETIKNSLN